MGNFVDFFIHYEGGGTLQGFWMVYGGVTITGILNGLFWIEQISLYNIKLMLGNFVSGNTIF